MGAAQKSAEDLYLQIGVQSVRIDSQRRGDRLYFSVRDLVEALHLRSREDNRFLTLSGPRGSVELFEDRPLIRAGRQQILISEPVWRQKKREWWVPEDFVTRVLPLVLDASFDHRGSHRYQLHQLSDNAVGVRLHNYSPNYVRIVFEPEKTAPVRVSEFKNYILVEFRDYRVVPALPAERPDVSIVAGIDFDRQTTFGTFKLYKGPSYHHFRQFALRDPVRQVIDVYGSSAAEEGDGGDSSSPRGETPASGGLDRSSPFSETERPSPFDDRDESRRLFESVVTLDPGHGGNDAGVHPVQDIQEKDLTLALAREVREKLRWGSLTGRLTRSRDVDVALDQRAALGNYYDSRAFISLHVGASRSSKQSGPMVYVYGPLEADSRQSSAEENPDASPATRLTLWDEGQRAHVPDSMRLARILQAELNQVFGASNIVSEAPLTVLEPVQSPAIFVEFGYLTSSSDLERLSSAEGREEIASAVARAVERFLR